MALVTADMIFMLGGAIQSLQKGASAGLALESVQSFPSPHLTALRAGSVTTDQLTDAVHRTLTGIVASDGCEGQDRDACEAAQTVLDLLGSRSSSVGLPSVLNPETVLRAQAQIASLPAARGVVLIDDEEAIRDSLGELLEAAGHRVFSAGTGREGLDLIAEHGSEIGLAIVDYALVGGMNGLQVVAEMRKTQQTPVFFVTGSDLDTVALDRIKALGNITWIRKPIQSSKFVAAVGQLLQEKVSVEDSFRRMNEAELRQFVAGLPRSLARIGRDSMPEARAEMDELLYEMDRVFGSPTAQGGSEVIALAEEIHDMFIAFLTDPTRDLLLEYLWHEYPEKWTTLEGALQSTDETLADSFIHGIFEVEETLRSWSRQERPDQDMTAYALGAMRYFRILKWEIDFRKSQKRMMGLADLHDAKNNIQAITETARVGHWKGFGDRRDELESFVNGLVEEMRTRKAVIQPGVRISLISDMGRSNGETSLGLHSTLTDAEKYCLKVAIDELVNNALEHGRATEVIVGLSQEGGGVSLVVGDNGRGLSEKRTGQTSRGWGEGRQGLAERAAALGWHLATVSTPEVGTTVKLTMMRLRR